MPKVEQMNDDLMKVAHVGVVILAKRKMVLGNGSFNAQERFNPYLLFS